MKTKRMKVIMTLKRRSAHNDMAPSRFSAYGNGDPLRGAKLQTGVCVKKKSGLGIVMGPRNLNRKVRNHVCGTEDPLLRKDMVATAVRLANVLITTQRVHAN